MRPMHLEKITVWYRYLLGVVIDPIFFFSEKIVSLIITVTSKFWKPMINNLFWLEVDTNKTWFQHNYKTCLTTNETLNIQFECFEVMLTSRGGDVTI